MKFEYYEIRACTDNGDEIASYLGDGDWRSAQAEAEATGLKVFWTLYGRTTVGLARAIGDFSSFQAAYEVMQAILLPIREACDRHYDPLLDDMCNQSSSEERL